MTLFNNPWPSPDWVYEVRPDTHILFGHKLSMANWQQFEGFYFLPSPSWSMGPSDVSGPAFSPAVNLKN